MKSRLFIKNSSLKKLVLVLVVFLLVLSCAKRGTPSGGPKDDTPPEIIKSYPENYSTNFSAQEIRINFNEYIKAKDLNKQLIISPPLKYQPIIFPQSGASKQLKIKILDTLKANTTYSFNFGNSIVDNNEENPFPFFKYVFSTGESIDSLTLGGSVKDALSNKTDDYISVLLYEIDSTYIDSTVYKEKPRYITNTLDSATTFKFENLKEGTYKLIALKEEADNYIFNQETDKIGFIEQELAIPTTEQFELKLFKEIKNYKAKKPKHHRKTRIRFRYEGPYNNEIKISRLTQGLPEEFESLITKDIDSDTLNYWFKPEIELDSMLFVQQYKTAIDTFKVRIRKKVKKDSLEFKRITSSLELDANYEISANIPVSKINKEKIKLLDRDSVAIPFSIQHDKFINKLSFVFDKKEKQQYKITAYPEAFIDYYGNANDTLQFSAVTKSLSNYGTIKVNLNNLPNTPIIVQLVTKDGKVKYQQFGTNKSVFDFLNISPSTYFLRVVFDDNGNKKYDTGNYLKVIQPERVSYYPEEIEIRANWDIDQTFTLK